MCAYAYEYKFNAFNAVDTIIQYTLKQRSERV